MHNNSNIAKAVGSLPIALLAGIALILFPPATAAAYVGPGLGVAAIWVLLGPIAAIIVLIAIIGYYPARYWYKKLRHKRFKQQQDSRATQNPDNDPDQ